MSEVDMLTSTQGGAPQIAAAYWAKRIVWLLVAVTSLWDIAVTFDKHFALTGRLF